MRKCSRRRPELESLESLTLLSASAAAHLARVPAQVAPAPLALAGTLQASAVVKGGRLVVSGSGVLSPVGPTTLQFSTRVDNPSYSVTLGTRHGKLILVGDSPIATTGSSSTHYRVIGGTGSYSRATGSGLATIAIGTPAGSRAPLTLTFS